MKLFPLILTASLVAAGQSPLKPTASLQHKANPARDAEVSDKLLSLHKDLVSIRSISGKEKTVGKFLKKYLEKHDFKVELQEVEKKRWNVLAYPKGSKRETKILVSSHIDTVPPFIPYQIRPGNDTEPEIWGRGSVDAKACVAAQTIAVLNLLKAKALDAKDSSLALLFVVGEETGGDGMRHFSDHKPANYSAVIFGEPTESKLATGHKGMLGLNIKVEGKAAHSGYPWLGVSANEYMTRALSALLALSDQGGLPSSEKYGATTLNIGKVTGGVAANVVAEKAEANIALRLAAGSAEDSKKILVDALAPVKQSIEDKGGALEVIFTHGYAPVDLDADVDGFDTITVNYGTDVPNLKGEHKKYLYGPGSILVAHGPQEHLRVEDLKNSVGDYEKLIKHALDL